MIVAATFGRSFWVLDDMSPLRQINPEVFSQDATLFAVGRPALRAQQLDGDLAIQLGVVRGVDLAHAAAPDQPQHDEAVDGLPALQHDAGGSSGRGV